MEKQTKHREKRNHSDAEPHEENVSETAREVGCGERGRGAAESGAPPQQQSIMPISYNGPSHSSSPDASQSLWRARKLRAELQQLRPEPAGKVSALQEKGELLG